MRNNAITLDAKFWGRPILIGATILLPKGYAENAGVSYPVHYEQGHFGTGAPGGFGEAAEPKPGATDREKERARRRQEFWRELRKLLPVWDERIAAFNEETGAARAFA